jgi:hypothetical protein
MGTGSEKICFGRILRFEGDRRASGGVRRLFFINFCAKYLKNQAECAILDM